MTADEITGREERIEVMLDLATAGWNPGDPCPECGHPVVHAILRAGATFKSDGSWRVEETVGVYEVFCSACGWLPSIQVC